MKRIFLSILAMGLLAALGAPAYADDQATPAKTGKSVKKTKDSKAAKAEKPDKKGKKDKKGKDEAAEEEEDAELSPVVAAIRSKQLVKPVKVDPKAKLFFVYLSRSTCGNCVIVLNRILPTYDIMKKNGVEFVMLNCDRDREAAEQWVNKANIPFPVVAPGEHGGIPFPFKGGSGILPFVVAVDAQGNAIEQANSVDSSRLIQRWRELMPDKSPTYMADLILGKKTAGSAKISSKAKVFYLMSTSPSAAELAAIGKAYPGMKGKGAELIMLHPDAQASGIAAWAKKEKIKFPVLSSQEARDIPFNYSGDRSPVCIVVVDAAGNKLAEASASNAVDLIKDHKKYVRDYEKREQEGVGNDQ